MLWVEIAAGASPVIYQSKRRLYLVSRKYLLKCYAFGNKAHAFQMLKKHPDRYEFSKFIQIVLLEMPTVPQIYWVQRRKLRKHVSQQIQSFPITKGD